MRLRPETDPTAGTAEPKGQSEDRDRPPEPGLRCLALTGEDFGRLVEAVGPEAVAFDPVSSEAAETEAAAAGVR
ncbi:hypothetical protein GGP77_000638 [Salinibacter ruber]|jgi:hypothetical protein|nr:hypothetical protein [Salinibacter ruber]